MADPEHPRFVLNNFLSSNQCKELEFIHKSCCTIGYRPSIFSTTLSHLIATNSAHLIMPFVPIRESLKETVELYFGCEYELCIEFTGLISWTKGSSIGWHSDDNRPYLKQRSYAAVCYLNNYEDFRGGLFHFQDGEPKTIKPMAGDVVLYTADSRNIHSVDEVTEGERLTLTLWFSRDSSYDEEAIFLSQSLPRALSNKMGSYLPLLAANNMYSFPPDDKLGFNICCARIYILGYDIFSPKYETTSSNSELLTERVQLAMGDELFSKEFVNVLHALQVLQFYHWRGSKMEAWRRESMVDLVVRLEESQVETMRSLKLKLLREPELALAVFGGMGSSSGSDVLRRSGDWAGLSAAVAAWEAYSSDLRSQLCMALPYWTSHRSLFLR